MHEAGHNEGAILRELPELTYEDLERLGILERGASGGWYRVQVRGRLREW